MHAEVGFKAHVMQKGIKRLIKLIIIIIIIMIVCIIIMGKFINTPYSYLYQ